MKQEAIILAFICVVFLGAGWYIGMATNQNTPCTIIEKLDCPPIPDCNVECNYPIVEECELSDDLYSEIKNELREIEIQEKVAISRKENLKKVVREVLLE